MTNQKHAKINGINKKPRVNKRMKKLTSANSLHYMDKLQVPSGNSMMNNLDQFIFTQMVYTYGQQHKTTDDVQINMLDNLCVVQKEAMKNGLNCIFKDINSIVNYAKTIENVRN